MPDDNSLNVMKDEQNYQLLNLFNHEKGVFCWQHFKKELMKRQFRRNISWKFIETGWANQ